MKQFCQILFCLISMMVCWKQTSCIREDLSGCVYEHEEIEVRIYYSYEQSNGSGRGINPAEVEQIHLFVFDEKNRFIKSITDRSPEFSTEYYHSINLQSGKYTFISWANVRDCYFYSHQEFIEGVTTLEEILLHYDTGKDNIVKSGPHSLFHSSGFNVEVSDVPQQDHFLPVVKNTYIINVTATGCIDTSVDYDVSIQDKGNSYKFNNEYASEEDIIYVTACGKNSEMYPYGSLTVQRLIEDRKYAELKLHDVTNDQILYKENLVEMLLLYHESNSLDFRTIYEYDVEINFDGSGEFVITINGWKVKDNGYDLSGK